MSDETIDVAAPDVDKPIDEADASGAPEQAVEPSNGEEPFTGFDPSSIPESGASPQWLKEQYDLMRGDYTRKMQEFGETRRTSEQLQTILDGIKEGDPQTRQSYLNLLGVDQQAILEAYGLEMAEQEAEEAAAQGEPEFDEDLDFRDPRVDQLLAERQQAEQIQAQEAFEQEATRQADEQGDIMERELTDLYGGKEPSEEDATLIFTYALENPDKLGNPDVQAGFQFLKARDESRQKEWLESRMAPRATTPGVPGTSRFDRSTKEGRIAEAQLAAAEARSSAQ